jgi:alginate O-acetyltransferase complex protein AlgI
VSYDTLYFALFLAFVWAAYKMLPWRGAILLAASVVFYSVAGLRDSMLAAIIILANYAFQFLVVRGNGWLSAALAINFACLASFKYRVFLSTAAGSDLFVGSIVIPLGISFYIFQLSAFLVDLARKRAEPFYSLPRFALFKLFFGQLIAGPIMRWKQFGPQVHRLFEGAVPHSRLVTFGAALCLLGLTKKVILADSLAPYVDTIFRDGPANAAAAWFGLWLFGFQIYFDFSGYCDIALGIGCFFGMRLAVNFRQPYLSFSPQEFWRRWHITLSQWIRDYLYVPLGGRDGGLPRQAAVLIFVMALAGLWHGANWTFVVWGIGWAILVIVWRVAGTALSRLGVIEWALTLFCTMVLWTFFRAADLPTAIRFIETLFGGGGYGRALVPDDHAAGLLIVSGCAALLALHWGEAQLFTRRAAQLLLRWDGPFLHSLLIGISLWILLLPKPLNTPFIYFRF